MTNHISGIIISLLFCSDQSETLHYSQIRAFCTLSTRRIRIGVTACRDMHATQVIGEEKILMHTADVALTLYFVVAFSTETCSVTGLPITEPLCRRCTTCSACSLMPERTFALQAVVGRDGKPEAPRNIQAGIGRTDWIVSTLLEGAIGCVICGSRWASSAGYAL